MLSRPLTKEVVGMEKFLAQFNVSGVESPMPSGSEVCHGQGGDGCGDGCGGSGDGGGDGCSNCDPG